MWRWSLIAGLHNLVLNCNSVGLQACTPMIQHEPTVLSAGADVQLGREAVSHRFEALRRSGEECWGEDVGGWETHVGHESDMSKHRGAARTCHPFGHVAIPAEDAFGRPESRCHSSKAFACFAFVKLELQWSCFLHELFRSCQQVPRTAWGFAHSTPVTDWRRGEWRIEWSNSLCRIALQEWQGSDNSSDSSALFFVVMAGL